MKPHRPRYNHLTVAVHPYSLRLPPHIKNGLDEAFGTIFGQHENRAKAHSVFLDRITRVPQEYAAYVIQYLRELRDSHPHAAEVIRTALKITPMPQSRPAAARLAPN